MLSPSLEASEPKNLMVQFLSLRQKSWEFQGASGLRLVMQRPENLEYWCPKVEKKSVTAPVFVGLPAKFMVPAHIEDGSCPFSELTYKLISCENTLPDVSKNTLWIL